MHPVVLYILGLLGAGLVGVLSAAIVFGLWRLLSGRIQVRLEMVFAVCGLAGLATLFVGRTIDSRALTAASVALWAWVTIPILVIPVLLLCRFVVWCRQRITGSL
jgi:uncharacterized membrane protein YuzA (DUF378 family)